MLVHSFSAAGSWFDDYADFARALGAEPAHGTVGTARTIGETQLHLGRVTGDVPPPPPPLPKVALTERFDRAVRLARTLHEDQRRKGGEIPYLAHFLAFASLLIEDGGDEDEAIAALARRGHLRPYAGPELAFRVAPGRPKRIGLNE